MCNILLLGVLLFQELNIELISPSVHLFDFFILFDIPYLGDIGGNPITGQVFEHSRVCV